MASPALKGLLFDIRQHAAFEELVSAMQPPPLPRFRESQADDAEAVKARWVFASGKLAQHDAWEAFLRGGTKLDESKGTG